MLGHGLHVHFGLVLRVLRNLQIVQGNSAVCIQILGALQLSPDKSLIREGLSVVGIAARDVVASNGQQQLAFLHRVAESRVNGHDAPGGQRNNGDVARHVGSEYPRDDQLGSRRMLGRRGQRKLLRVIHREEADVQSLRDLSRRWILRNLVRAHPTTAAKRRERSGKQNQRKTVDFHKYLGPGKSTVSSPQRRREFQYLPPRLRVSAPLR